jgi:hypothetical protein
MAHLHQATLVPSKLELVEGWVTAQPWFAGDADGTFETIANYRFDDPLGEVGLEVLFVRAGDGPVMQVALTYRAEPYDEAESWLIGTLIHSVLGKRWVYDATGDPAFVAALATAILTGGREAELMVETPNGMVRREASASVRGSGSTAGPDVAADDIGTIDTRETPDATVVTAADLRVVLLRRPDDLPGASAEDALVGSWTGHPDETTLATLA